MLPIKIKEIKLSSDASLRLETYYKRFCTGGAEEGYGMGHLLFACYAAFPLLLSPDLANYLWLNFKTYQNRSGMRQIDRVAVSDLLLSSLVRPVARRQFEVLPEIRNYLLYLLQDGSWFGDYGVLLGEADPLLRLAQFLDSYTKDESSARETNADSFREMNQWAALAYLSPGELTIRVGRQLAAAVASGDESRQLRLNVLMERIGAQAALNPLHASNKGKAAFKNLRSYSQGNRARLFQEPEQLVSDWYYQLNDAFISERSQPGQILLPLTRAAGNRISRRKEGRQRVIPLFVDMDMDHYHDSGNPTRPGQQFEDLLNSLSSRYGLFELEPFRQLKIKSLDDKFFNILEQMFASANLEDLVLIYYMGRGGDYRKAQLPYKSGSISAAEFQKRIAPFQQKGCQTLLIMDAPALGHAQWIKGGIQLYNQESELSNKLAETKSVFFNMLSTFLYQTGGWITYEDLAAVMPYVERFGTSETTIQPLLSADTRLKDQLVFTNRKQARHPDQFLLLYERRQKIWRVIEEDFKMITRYSKTTLLTYVGEPVRDSIGEFYIRSGILTFGGSTKGLDNKQIYRAQPEKRRLHIDVQSTRPGLNVSRISQSLQHIKRRGQMLWSSSPILERGSSNNYLLEIQADEEHSGSLTWNYFDQVQDQPLLFERKLSWTTPAVISPEMFLSKFSAFEYLMQLQYPDWFPERYKFNISFTGRWGLDGQRIKAINKDRLLITDDSFQILGGELKLKSLHLEVSYREEWPLFCDVYILGDDLSATKMTRQNLVVSSERQTFELSNTGALERLLGLGTACYLKILYSYKPILIDFYLEGLKDGRY
jgi:hypothetical protein